MEVIGWQREREKSGGERGQRLRVEKNERVGQERQ